MERRKWYIVRLSYRSAIAAAIAVGELHVGEEDLVVADRERSQRIRTLEVAQGSRHDLGPREVEHVVGDHHAALGERRLGQEHVGVDDVVGVPAVDAEQADVTVGQVTHVVGGDEGRVTRMHRDPRRVGEAGDVGFEPCTITASGPVDVERLILEEIDGNGLLVVAEQEVEADQQLAVVDADLGGATPDAQLPLRGVEHLDELEHLGLHPPPDPSTTATGIRPELRTHGRDPNSACDPSLCEERRMGVESSRIHQRGT